VTWRIDPEGAEPRALAQLVSLEDLRVLELGCGDGRLTFRYADATSSVLAIDPDAASIEKARQTVPRNLRDRITFVVANAEEVDAPSASFDLALFSSSL
jgi:ubiquinone/menaquinone biosynthesis C-methylase UbiE